MAQRLASSTSAYLAQHAHQPVDWWPWGDEALAEAQRRNVPLFISIGYAACHWCHVMAHESFDDPAVAAVLNEHFVPVKVDREERPDVDALYMAAAQVVTGHGGWPLSIFALPDGRPFLAGTYFPPVDRHGQPGFGRLLAALIDAWATRRDDIASQADDIMEAVTREVRVLDRLAPISEALDVAAARGELRRSLVASLDPLGGFSGAPKFPRPDFVVALSEFTDEESRHAVTLTLDAMARGGIYDHLDGGFARYSVDASWRVPHFEKMLYDQALLAVAYTVAGRRLDRPDWLVVAHDTLDFVHRRLRVPGGYASSLDADAAGHEGSHVTWTLEQVSTALSEAGLADQLADVVRRWGMTAEGDLDGASVPHLSAHAPLVTPPSLVVAREALLTTRDRRPAPGRDGKVVLEWNAMLACAFLGLDDWADAGLALLDELDALRFDGVWFRTDGRTARATATDLAWLLDAQVTAFEVTGDDAWRDRAQSVASYLLAHHWDGPVPTGRDDTCGNGFFTDSDEVPDVPLRTREVFDGATPAALGVAARAFARWSLVSSNADAAAVARRLVSLGGTLVRDHPRATPSLVEAAGLLASGVEIVAPGATPGVRHALRSLAVPRSVIVHGNGSSPLLRDRVDGLIYLCRGGVCHQPVASVDDLRALLATDF